MAFFQKRGEMVWKKKSESAYGDSLRVLSGDTTPVDRAPAIDLPVDGVHKEDKKHLSASLALTQLREQVFVLREYVPKYPGEELYETDVLYEACEQVVQETQFSNGDDVYNFLHEYSELLHSQLVQTVFSQRCNDFDSEYRGGEIESFFFIAVIESLSKKGALDLLSPEKADVLMRYVCRMYGDVASVSLNEVSRVDEEQKVQYDDEMEYNFEFNDFETTREMSNFLLIFRMIGSRGGIETIHTTLPMLKNFGLGLRGELAPIYSRIDGPYASQYIAGILDSLRDAEAETLLYRRDLAVLLSRIDVGRLPISDNQASYLDKIITIESNKNIEGFLRRVQYGKQFGRFSPEGVLEDIVQVSESGSDLRGQLIALSVEHIVANPAPVGSAEYRLQSELLSFFKEHYLSVLEQTDCPSIAALLPAVPLPEQCALVHGLVQANEDERTQLERAYLSHGASIVHVCELLKRPNISVSDILTITTAFTHSVDCTQACDTYARLLLEIRRVRAESERVDSIQYTHAVCADAERRLQDIFLSLRDLPTGSVDTEQTDRLFVRVQTDVLLLSSLIRSMRAQGDTEQAEVLIESLDCQTKRGGMFSETEKDALHSLIVRNYIESDGSVREYGKTVAIPSLLRSLDDERNTFFVLKQSQQPVAFVRFEDRGDHYYGGSFNVSRDAQSSGIGELFLSQTFSTIDAEKKPIRAIAEIDKPIAAKYVNQFGFVITGLEQNKEGTGVHVFHIERSATYAPSHFENVDMRISLSLRSDAQTQMSEIEHYLRQGYVGTEVSRQGDVITIGFVHVDPQQEYSKVA